MLENQKPTYTKFEAAYESHLIKIYLEVTKLGQIIQSVVVSGQPFENSMGTCLAENTD